MLGSELRPAPRVDRAKRCFYKVSTTLDSQDNLSSHPDIQHECQKTVSTSQLVDMRSRNPASVIRCRSPWTRIKARRLRAANQTPAHATSYTSASWRTAPHALRTIRRRARRPGIGAGLLFHHIPTTLIPPPRASHYHTTRTRIMHLLSRIFLIMDIEHCPPMTHHKHAARRRVRRMPMDLPRPTPTTTLRRAC